MKCLLGALVCAGIVLGAEPSPGTAPAIKIDIPVEKYQLRNGLRVVLSEDNTLPAISVYIVYDVGARAEAKGRTGFAHLFEHMMFEGSANVKKGELDKYVYGNGGTLNGSTHPDYTNYFETMPSNKLALALWLESDRMRSLALTNENLANQKEAVKQERRLSFDNQPYATAIVDKWPSMVYQNWHNAHSLIGSFEDLNAATLADVQGFFKTYYAPNNAVLTIVGDIKIPEAKKLIEQYFGDIPRQEAASRPDLAEPAPAPAKSETYRDPLAKVPAVVIGFRGPKRNSPEFYAMTVLDALLTAGDSSRLQLDMVKGKKSVVQFEAALGWPFASEADYLDPGEYATFLIYKPNFKATDIVDQYQDEIAKIQKDGVSEEDLQRAKMMLLDSKLQRLQTTLGRATQIATFELLDGRPQEINSLLEHYSAVTAEQVKDVANRYLKASERSVLSIVPDPGAAKAPSAGGQK